MKKKILLVNGSPRGDGMKNTIIVWIYMLLLLSCSTENPQDEELGAPMQVMNLLRNGNCEEWEIFSGRSYYLDGWSMKENNGTLFKENKIVYEGKYAAKLCTTRSGITAFISQKVDIHPGHRLRLFFRYYMEYVSGNGARTYCFFRESSSSNIPADVLETFYDDKTLNIIRGGGYGLPRFSSENRVWKTFDYIITAPAIANYFVFEICGYFGTTIYIDDCYVIDLDM